MFYVEVGFGVGSIHALSQRPETGVLFDAKLIRFEGKRSDSSGLRNV